MTSLRCITDSPAYWDRLCQAKGNRIFDIGANGGGTAWIFAPHFGHVVAFEPCQESYDDLVAQLPQNVTAHNLAISDHAGVVTLREAAHSMSGGQLVTGESLEWGDTLGYREVLCTTLDEAAREWGEPDTIKVDVEGHELHVLAGAVETLSKRPNWMVEVHAEEYEEPLREALSGYQIEVLRHTGYREGSEGWRNHFYLLASN
jgi:FkbM family methyltransferase